MKIGREFFKDMVVLGDSRTRRISSWDRTGANRDFISIPSGRKAILGEIKGAGCINHVYFTQTCPDRHYLRKLLLRMYWDGEKNPSVEVPFGDFFGLGHCRIRLFTSLLICVNQGAFSYGFNSYFPMPFSDGAKIEIVNEGDETVPMLWYHIDYEVYGQSLRQDVGRFHAQWRRENPCRASEIPSEKPLFLVPHLTDENNYVILDAEGRGQYVGLFLNVDNIVGGWWGEGDDMIFIDGEKWPPSLHGTGTEEIFGGGASPNREYAGPYTGFHLISSPDWAGKNSMYRFYVTDPIRFRKSIRITIEHGHANTLANDYSSTAFWYQKEPHKPFHVLPVKERIPRETAEYSKAMENLKDVFKRIMAAREFNERTVSLIVEANEALDYVKVEGALKHVDEANRLLEI